MGTRTPDYQAGQLIPGTVYKVHRVLGAGGMGTVYDVEDTTVGRRYVLKTLHGDLADRSDLAARLSREARALAKLQHPNIVEVYTSGTTQDHLRLPFYVMERLQGQSLRVALERRGHLTLEQSYDIAIDLLDALDHAHEAGIIHRDVKPDNIFLTRGRDGRALAKLLDFGIIKLSGGSTLHTGGRFIGTFRYAPPEQILGKDVTPRSDLYSAALVLYEMVAGRGPFDDFMGEVEIGKAHIDVPPPSVSRFAQVPPALDALLTSALSKKAELRPESAYAFATSLRELKRQLVGEIQRANGQTTSAPVVSSVPDTARNATELASQRDVVPASDGSTLPDTPQARVGATVPVAGSATLMMGPPQGMPQAQPASAPFAPPPGTAAPITPQMAPARPPIDRNAETRQAQPFAPNAPSNDTAVIAPPPPEPAPPRPVQMSTVPALHRSKGTPWGLILGIGAFVVVALSAGGFFARRAFDRTPSAPSANATVATVEPTATLTTPMVTSVVVPVASSAAPIASSTPVVATAIPTVIATSTTTAVHSAAVTPSAKPSATARPTANPTSTATSTASGPKRPGSGL